MGQNTVWLLADTIGASTSRLRLLRLTAVQWDGPVGDETHTSRPSDICNSAGLNISDEKDVFLKFKSDRLRR